MSPTTTGTATTATRELMEGSEALVRASIAAGCRFFAGYPMTPFTEVLEHFARLLPDVGGVCINAESELEAVGMAWGALATGARAATGSTGQGLSLMQESFSEITLAELPLVVFNMARGQQDYFQATRGGGHGDYRHIVLAPQDVREGVRLVQLAFHLADKWRNPVLVYGDYLLAHTQEAIAIEPVELPELPPKAWAVDGSSSGSGAAGMGSSSGNGAAGIGSSSGSGVAGIGSSIAPAASCASALAGWTRQQAIARLRAVTRRSERRTGSIPSENGLPLGGETGNRGHPCLRERDGAAGPGHRRADAGPTIGGFGAGRSHVKDSLQALVNAAIDALRARIASPMSASSVLTL